MAASRDSDHSISVPETISVYATPTYDAIPTDDAIRHPSDHLLSSRNSRDYFRICVPAYEAALKGNLKAIKNLIQEMDNGLVNSSITEGYETVLHIATGAKQTALVKEIVENMKPDLELRDENNNTAFSVAAAVGAIEIAKIMLKKNHTLLTARGARDRIPLFMAAMFGRGTMASYLYDEHKKTERDLEETDREDIFLVSIHTGLYNLAIKLLSQYGELASARSPEKRTALHILAQQPSAFASRIPRPLQRLINWGLKLAHNTAPLESSEALTLVKCLWKKIKDDLNVASLLLEPSNVLIDATKCGNVVFLNELLHSYPHMVHNSDENKRTILHIAVLYRRPEIFKLIHERGPLIMEVLALLKDRYENSLLDLAAKYSPLRTLNITPGAALQMQQELLMFKEIEKLVKPEFGEASDVDHLKAQKLFAIKHAELKRRGEKWMRNTANSCMIVATLIFTIVFHAAFTVPGGYHSTKGIPIHLSKTMFRVFEVTNVTALFSSSISILMFLSIHTSRFTDDEFLTRLPLKLMVGLWTLFMALTCMMIAFTCNVFLAHRDTANWVPLLTGAFAVFTVFLYAVLQLPLLIKVFISTFRFKLF